MDKPLISEGKKLKKRISGEGFFFVFYFWSRPVSSMNVIKFPPLSSEIRGRSF
jgi:hypothetical protein